MSVRVDVVDRYSVTLTAAAEREYRRLAQTDETAAQEYAQDWAFDREEDAYHDVEATVEDNAPGAPSKPDGPVDVVPTLEELREHADAEAAE